MRHLSRAALATLSAFTLALGASACGDDNDGGGSTGAGGTTTTASKAIQSNADNAKTTITVGSKNFTEEFILAEIYAQALEAAGYTVKKQLNLGSEQVAFKALKKGQVDAYPEYTGTALTSFFDVKIDKVPRDDQAAYELAKTNFAKDKLTALAPTPFTDSNGVGMAKAKAEKLGIKTISDLKDKASTLSFYGTPECPQRPDCLLGLKQVYGLKFKKVVAIDPGLRHKVLDSGQADVSIVYTTDGQIAQGKETLLEDDMHMFPPYNVTLVFKAGALKALGPDATKAITLVQKGLTTQAMQELNSRVDIDKQTPAAVAGQYLKSSGFVK